MVMVAADKEDNQVEQLVVWSNLNLDQHPL